MKNVYIFDLDGTLVNSVYDLADAMNTVLEQHGLPGHQVDEYKYFVGNGTLKLVERAIPQELRTKDKTAELHREFTGIYSKCAVRKTRAYDGVKELLELLRSKGFRLAVASNKPDIFSRQVVETVLGKGIFDCIMGKRDGVPSKPDPSIMFNIMNELGADRSECIHSGDSNVDILTAKSAGIDCIGCTWGFRTRDELIQAGAELIADKPMDIYSLSIKAFGEGK